MNIFLSLLGWAKVVVIVGGWRRYAARRGSREAILGEQCTVIRPEVRGTGGGGRGVDVACDAEREVIMSLVLAFHIPPSPTLPRYQCHLPP